MTPAPNPLIAAIVLLLSSVPAFAQTIVPTPFQVFLDNSGNIVNGGCVWTYSAGTTTPATTYTDSALTTPNANPIKADSAGRWVAYLTVGQGYKFTYENIPCSAVSHGTTLKTVDNVRGVPTSDVTSLRQLAEGRLTATSATPVTTADVSAAASIYYTPYLGTRIALYDGSASWNVRTFSELTISVSSCTASKPYDVFLYDNSGTVTAETLVWTNTTTRATGLTTQDGIFVKSGVTTRRYVGTFYCNATGGQTDDSAAKRYLWNYYNRARRSLLRQDAAASWSYTIATYQQANASASNQVDLVVGVAEVTVQVGLLAITSQSNTGVNVGISIGEDSATTAATGVIGALHQFAATSAYITLVASLTKMPAVGRHFYAWLEISAATGTTTWYGAATVFAGSRAGLYGWIEG